jgi:VIT1/CCC1 family predicted Fe2+/Mn2+ transporter
VTASLYKAAADNLIPQRKKVSFFSRRFMTERIATGTVGLTPLLVTIAYHIVDALPKLTNRFRNLRSLVEFGEGMEEITRFRTIWSGALVGIGYLLGGLIPLMPYFIIADNVLKALLYVFCRNAAFPALIG